ncbi:hypothetical protein AB833_31800 [Chromatiales bacterium (ex Bugula neritina AB1)]|nr:hypothetical protein AB833_31800 [Chromatiales bacterium (ex Bugula neritina AB1)]
MLVRESGKKLSEGFYTDHSWLDVEDYQVVFLESDHLAVFKFDKDSFSEVQKAYQTQKSFSQLVQLAKGTQLIIPFSQITELESRHDKNTLTVCVSNEGEDSAHEIEFINPATKSHALSKIEKLLPGALNHEKVDKSRLASASIAIIVLAISLGVMA